MFKRITGLLLAFSLILALGIGANATEQEFKLYVDGQEVSDAYAILENGVTYVSVYHVTMALRSQVTVSWAYGKTILSGEDFTLSLAAGDSYLVCNQRYLYVPETVRPHPQWSSVLLVPVRTLAKALGAEVGWSQAGVTLTTGGAALESGESFYNETDVDLIARVIAHESRNQPLAGKIAVANVILNRVSSNQFPNTVSEVLNQKNQFPGATNSTATAECVLAAKLALDGANTAGNACWFNGVGKSCWASKNKALIATIGGHAFYG